nr:hypothetical protein Iba_scaffold57318CG0010 [Ipomoea batatas]
MAEACPRPSCMLNQTPSPLLALGATVAAHPQLPPLPQPRLEALSSPKDNREGRKHIGLLGWEVAIAKLRYRRRPTSLKRARKLHVGVGTGGAVAPETEGKSTTPSSAAVVRFLPEHPQLCMPPPKPLPEPREGIVALAPSRHALTTAGVVRRRCWLPGIVRS